jgi:hypothetical protein
VLSTRVCERRAWLPPQKWAPLLHGIVASIWPGSPAPTFNLAALD